MKKLLVILLSAIMVLSLAACGGGEDTKAPSAPASSSSTQAEPATKAADKPAAEATDEPADEATDEPAAEATGDTVTDYEASMSEFITQFETLSVKIGELMEGYDGSDEWFTAFGTIYQAVSDATDVLATTVAQAPEEYQESHTKITFAVAAYVDMMDAFGTAVDAYQADDAAKGDEQMAVVQGLYEAAAQLWSESVESAE